MLKAIEVGEDHATQLVKCSTVLQNVVIHREGTDMKLVALVKKRLQHISESRSALGEVTAGHRYNHSPVGAEAIRTHLKNYFNSDRGCVPWQDRYKK